MTSFNPRSEKSLVELYPQLEPATELTGVYIAEIPGAKFLEPVKKFFLRLAGLPGWQGKHFFDGYALNILTKRGEIYEGPKMIIQSRPHKIDDKAGLVATYDASAPYIWRHCIDEFRQVDQDTLLGMSHFDLPGLRGKPHMFILHRRPEHKGLA